MKLFRLVGLGLVIVAAALAASWFWLPASVTTVTVTRGSAAEVIYATGVVEPERWAKVVPLQRERVVELCYCEGQSVEKGQILGRQDTAEQRATLSELEARRTLLDKDYERLSRLLDRGTISVTTFDQTATLLKEIEARIAAQKERIDALVLRAPMTGVVLRRDGEVGEIAGQTDVLFWVGQPKPLRIVAEVNEEDIPRVSVGQKVLLRNDGFESGTLHAKVGAITPKGDPISKTFRVYLDLPDDTPLRIGMSVEANIVVREAADALLVPAEAVQNDAVYMIAEGDRLRRVPVRVDLRGTRLVAVSGDLAPGQRVVSPAAPTLADGARVRPRGGQS